MTDGKAVIVETRDQKMYITLNRPEALNAQNSFMRQELNAAFDELDKDDGLRVAIMRGAGRAFCAGADIKEVAALSQSNGGQVPDSFDGRSHFYRCDQLLKPIIAVVHGYAVGGGLELALCCDLRVATADAQLGTPEARTIGGVPGIAIHRLPRMMPTGEALKLMFTSRPITGERAYDVGLVQAVAPDIDSAMTLAEGLADEIIECNPESVRMIKQIARWPLLSDVSNSVRFEEMTKKTTSLPFRGADFLA